MAKQIYFAVSVSVSTIISASTLSYHIITDHVRSFCVSLSWLAYFFLIFNLIILLTFSLVDILPVFASKFGTFHLISIHSVLSLCGPLASLFLLLFPRFFVPCCLYLNLIPPCIVPMIILIIIITIILIMMIMLCDRVLE